MLKKKLLGLLIVLSSLVLFSEKTDAVSTNEEERTYQQSSVPELKELKQGEVL